MGVSKSYKLFAIQQKLKAVFWSTLFCNHFKVDSNLNLFVQTNLRLVSTYLFNLISKNLNIFSINLMSELANCISNLYVVNRSENFLSCFTNFSTNCYLFSF